MDIACLDAVGGRFDVEGPVAKTGTNRRGRGRRISRAQSCDRDKNGKGISMRKPEVRE